ncbi:MAG: hypothetical protein HRT89_22605 [Lentisphaeria bacterium]|nr:hypothetical protein [Lentisphaeria bacterium]
MFSFSKNKNFSPASIEEQLSVVPVRNEHIKIVEDTDELMLLEIENRMLGGNRGISSFLKLRKEKIYELRGLGLQLYRQVNGRDTVKKMILEIKKQHLLGFHEARALTVNLLYVMVQHGLIVIVMSDEINAKSQSLEPESP